MQAPDLHSNATEPDVKYYKCMGTLERPWRGNDPYLRTAPFFGTCLKP